MEVNRREVLAAAALAGAALAARSARATAAQRPLAELDFAALGDGDGWPGWTCPGVANLRRAGGAGLLEAGTDVFPSDPRPVAFVVDRRVRDAEIAATFRRTGAGSGLVLRRTGPRDLYAAVLDDEAGALRLLRRRGTDLDELARAAVAPPPGGPVELVLRATGAAPTTLEAELRVPGRAPVTVRATDDAPALQRPGDAGVLATARTLFPSEGPPVLPALGNLHLLPYGVQEGQAFIQGPAGEPLLGEIRERSTAELTRVVLRSAERPGPTLPSVIAATTGAPLRGGARLRVATDVPARVRIELSADRDFRRSTVLRQRITGRFDALDEPVRGLPAGRTVFWRPRLRRRRRDVLGPVRSFRVLPAAGSPEPVRLAVGSCAAQFGPIFAELERRAPDVFVWQGDLNYADTLGPLAQTTSGYAGIWRELLANPRTEGLLRRTAFAAQRDDHDLGLQDANARNLVPWGLAPWEALVEPRPFFRFSAGLAEVWVLDQRLEKSDPALPDTPAKTLLGERQREWLLRTLARSRAPFKVVCSPCTLAPLPANARDGSWASGFTAERDLLLRHVRERVSGRTVFVTGDTHWTMAYDRDGLLEVRACPLGIPTPNDITLVDPTVASRARGTPGVVYADDTTNHVCLLDVRGEDAEAVLAITLVREDGRDAFRRELRLPR